MWHHSHSLSFYHLYINWRGSFPIPLHVLNPCLFTLCYSWAVRTISECINSIVLSSLLVWDSETWIPWPHSFLCSPVKLFSKPFKLHIFSSNRLSVLFAHLCSFSLSHTLPHLSSLELLSFEIYNIRSYNPFPSLIIYKYLRTITLLPWK
jgi:hypothetical protein